MTAAFGRDAIHAAYAALDGSGKETLLRTWIEETEHAAIDTVLPLFYQGGKRKIASYAPLVFQAAKAGDPVAEEIIDRNLEVVATLLRTAEQQFSTHVPAVIAGGVTHEETVLPRLQQKLGVASRLDLRILDGEPVDGAVLLARKLYPVQADKQIHD